MIELDGIIIRVDGVSSDSTTEVVIPSVSTDGIATKCHGNFDKLNHRRGFIRVQYSP
jgi:hypothetical protein